MSMDFLVPNYRPLGVVCRDNADAWPDRVAIIENGRETSWGELDRRVSQIANGLTGIGIGTGDHIAVLGRNDAQMFELMHAAAWTGAIYMPINWRNAAEEVAYILNDSGARVLFVSHECWARLQLRRDSVRTLQHIFLFDGEAFDGAVTLADWRSRQSARRIEREIDPDEPVVQLYTSGTTGQPKGAVISHRYWMAIGAATADAYDMFQLREGEVILHYLPMFHMGGVAFHYFPACRGCGIVVLPQFEVGEVLRLTSLHRAPLLMGVPTMLSMLAEDPRMATTDLSSVRRCMYGAAPMSITLRDMLMERLNCEFLQQYAMTEAGYVCCLTPQDHLGAMEKGGSVGRPVQSVELKILDAEGRELPTGEIGEIALRTPSIMKGYWNLPEATRAAFRDGWYLTGDGGYVDEDGYVFLKARVKDMIISGGENIYPAEIENVLMQDPAVLSAAVVGVADDRWGEVPKAFVVTRPGHVVSIQDLHAFAGRHLGRFRLPKYYELVEDLPLTPSGKVAKFELRLRPNDKETRVSG